MKKIAVVSSDAADLLIRYQEEANPLKNWTTPVSGGKKEHLFTLLYLRPSCTYLYDIVCRQKEGKDVVLADGKFTTNELPAGMQDIIFPVDIRPLLSETFEKGAVLLARRDIPGQAYLANAKGDIIWYHTIADAGFKVAHFTGKSTILSIVAPLSYPTSYGNEILELSLAGDTLFHLKKGERGFDRTIHHEIFYNDAQQLVTLTQEKKIMDLRRAGGTAADTITGDGILVLDSVGNKVWEWTVFDVMDPLTDPQIKQNRTDWLHANSLSLDTDGNYLVSFYLSGQIWKVDAKSGKLLWKLGRNGDFVFRNCNSFSEVHAVHRTANNQLLLFENGIDQQHSAVREYVLDEKNHTADASLAIGLPSYLYSERMGSVYRVGDTSLLVCSAQANAVSLINKSGDILWRIRTGFIPYRAEFVSIDH
ncbi:aryl-sulfate sulfotransferase [Flavihumibacter petaseus]|uniref:Arylsulfotransferase N-terminal domain-containing protein n=1 Tax=Flavihumibacter petaseus NBRC 106054 TaxID=1220578 RepID=A0A0E9MYB5_9BACT|nr:aryl-sulfate sulfotransferase [Flavihumibacter petaseus]GAO42727.1 hypothetical protein FPE01S_01_17450 [Flavihumibacter petaseus NBRC 106054]